MCLLRSMNWAVIKDSCTVARPPRRERTPSAGALLDVDLLDHRAARRLVRPQDGEACGGISGR